MTTWNSNQKGPNESNKSDNLFNAGCIVCRGGNLLPAQRPPLVAHCLFFDFRHVFCCGSKSSCDTQICVHFVWQNFYQSTNQNNWFDVVLPGVLRNACRAAEKTLEWRKMMKSITYALSALLFLFFATLCMLNGRLWWAIFCAAIAGVLMAIVAEAFRSSKPKESSVCPECGRIYEKPQKPTESQKQEWPISTCLYCGQLRISVKAPDQIIPACLRCRRSFSGSNPDFGGGVCQSCWANSQC